MELKKAQPIAEALIAERDITIKESLLKEINKK